MNKQTLYYSLVTAIAGALANNAYEKTNTATSAKAGADAIRNYGASVKAMAKAVTEAVWEEYEDKEPEKGNGFEAKPQEAAPQSQAVTATAAKTARQEMLEALKKKKEAEAEAKKDPK